MSTPYIVTCKECFRADEVTVEADYLTNEWVYACDAHGTTPYVWRVPAPVKDTKKYRETKLAELGVYEVLEQCIKADDPWLEWGIIEDRFRRADPALYTTLVGMYSHSARDARHGGTDHDTKNTRKTSNRLSNAMAVLADEGFCEFKFGAATGFWSYNTQISHWAPRPAPPKNQLLTWEQYATDNDLDPNSWLLPPETP